MTATSDNKKKQGTLTPEKFIRGKVRLLPLGKCYVNESWYDLGKGTIIVSRIHPNGKITCGFYLIDLFCTGIKDSFYLYEISKREFEQVLDEMSEKEDLLEVEYTLIHNIIYGSMDFAGSYKFKPHKSFALTQFILEEDSDKIEFINIPFGIDGLPAVVVSNEEPKLEIINKLEKTAGKDNYIVMDESEFEDVNSLMSDVVLEKNDENCNVKEFDGYDMNEGNYEDDSLLGDYESYTENELLSEIEELGEDDVEDAIGPVYELFVRLQDPDKMEALYEKHAQVFEDILIVNDFSYPGLNYIPEGQHDLFYELAKLTEENPEDAIIAVNHALTKFPHPVYEYLMVSAYGYLGMHDEATRVLKQAMEKYSNNLMIRVGYGFILLMENQFDSLKMFMSGFDLKKVAPDRKVFHIIEIGRFLCLACSYYALTNQLSLATIYQKILDDFTDIPESTYYQKLTAFKILCSFQLENIRQTYKR
jgi:tetratricopeptide (TPR) repeat protein